MTKDKTTLPSPKVKNEKKQRKKLNKEVDLWISDAVFWLDEIDDCQQLLDKNFPKIDELEEEKQLDHFQNLIIYYKNELLPELKHDLLVFQKDIEGDRDLAELIKSYQKLDERISAIREQMKERRLELNLFIKTI